MHMKNSGFSDRPHYYLLFLSVPDCLHWLLLRACALPCPVRSLQDGAAGVCGQESRLRVSQGVPVLILPFFFLISGQEENVMLGHSAFCCGDTGLAVLLTFPSTPKPWPHLRCPLPQPHFPSGLWFTLCTPTSTCQSWAVQVLWLQRTEDQFQLA